MPRAGTKEEDEDMEDQYGVSLLRSSLSQSGTSRSETVSDASENGKPHLSVLSTQ